MRKKMVLLAVFGIALAGLFFVLLPLAHAAEESIASKYLTGNYDESVRVYDMIVQALGIDQNGFASAMIGFSEDVMKIIQGISILWITTLTIASVIKESATFDRDGQRLIAYSLAKIITGFVLVIYCVPIMDALNSGGMALLDAICNGAIGTARTMDSFSGAYAGAGIFTTFCILYIRIVGYGLQIEFVLRRIFMPLGISSIVTTGVRSPGFRYLKRYFAIYLKMAVIALTILVAAEIAQGLVDGFIVLCSACAFMGKAAGFVDQVLGID